MKNASLTLLVAAVALGTASAGLTTLLLRSSRASVARGDLESRDAPVPPGARWESAPNEGPIAAPDRETIARIERRLEELTVSNSALVQRLEALEETREPARGHVSREEFEELRDELLEPGPRRNAAPAEPVELKQQVAGALSEIRKEEAVRKVETYQEERAARLDESVAKISEWLELSTYQRDEVRTALAAQYDREAELTRLWKSGAYEDDVLGEMKRNDRDAFRADLGRSLTPEQVETFWARIAGGGKDDAGER